MHPGSVDLSAGGNRRFVSQQRVGVHGLAITASWYALLFDPRTLFLRRCPSEGGRHLNTKKNKDVAVLRTHINCIATFLCDVGDGTKGARREHDLMVVDERVLVDTTEDITP